MHLDLIRKKCLYSGITYPCDDGGEQLQKRCESLQLSLGDASHGWVAVLRGVWVWDVSSQVLVVQHEGVEEMLPRHRVARHSLDVITCKYMHHMSYKLVNRRGRGSHCRFFFFSFLNSHNSCERLSHPKRPKKENERFK